MQIAPTKANEAVTLGGMQGDSEAQGGPSGAQGSEGGVQNGGVQNGGGVAGEAETKAESEAPKPMVSGCTNVVSGCSTTCTLNMNSRCMSGERGDREALRA